MQLDSLILEDYKLVLGSTFQIYDKKGKILASKVLIKEQTAGTPKTSLPKLLHEIAQEVVNALTFKDIKLEKDLENTVNALIKGGKFPANFDNGKLYTFTFDNGQTSIFEVLKKHREVVNLYDSEGYFQDMSNGEITEIVTLDIQETPSEDIYNKKILRKKDMAQTQQRKKMFGF